MNIFIVPSWFPQNNNQGIFVLEQAQALKRRGHDVTVLSVQMKSVKYKEKTKDIYVERIDGINVVYIEKRVLKPSTFRILTCNVFSNVLEKLYLYAIGVWGIPDVVYAHFSYPAGYSASLLARKYNLPLVIEEHYSYFYQDKVSASMRFILKKTVLGSDNFIAVSRGLQSSILRHTSNCKSIGVISNMINPCFTYHDIPNESTYRFFSMGNLIPRKGFEELIVAFSKVFSNRENVTLIIAGNGEQYGHLNDLIKKNNMDNQIKLIGEISRTEALDEYIKCNCFVLASHNETFGLVYREALAVGRPIISTNHGGFSDDDWYDEYGYLIELDDTVALESALKDMYNNQKQFNGEKISKMCLATCSEEVVITQIEETLANACNLRR